MQYQRLEGKLDHLREIMGGRTPALLACSGGLDSRFMAHVAKLWGMDVEAVFFAGPHLTPGEIHFAKDWLSQRRIGFHVLQFNPLNQERTASNLRDRCYHCKRAIFTRVRILAEDLGRPYILDGSNFSDASEYRPGRMALKEMGVESPLALAGLAKSEVRRAAQLTGMDWPNQPARACLLTRLAYGLPPSEELLARLALAEDALARLGLRQFRLRVLPPSKPHQGSHHAQLPHLPSHAQPPARPQYALHIARGEQTTWMRVRSQGMKALRLEGFFPCKVELLDSISGYFDTPGTQPAPHSSGQDDP